MKDTQTITTDSAHSERLYFGSPVTTGYTWNNVIIEKRVSLNWLYKLYKDSIFHDFVLIFFSPVH